MSSSAAALVVIFGALVRGDRHAANAQAVRDLRTLRDAAIILESYKFEPECERLVAIVKQLAADPDKAIEQSGDTDEDKAEAVERTRQPKAAMPPASSPAPAR